MLAKHDEWATQPDLMKVLNKEFHFTLEVCATEQNRALPKLPYMGLDNNLNALEYDWGNPGGVCYCNPPYSKLGEFVEKAFNEGADKKIVLLIPAYTDTKYFQVRIAAWAEQVRFLKGRLKFWENGAPGKDSARFPSAVVVFSPYGRHINSPAVQFWDWQGT